MFETLLHNSTMPILTAFILGLMTIISPCPFCSNLTAIGYISKDIANRRRTLLSGMMYALGKIFTYSALSLIFIFGAQIQPIQHFFETYGEPILGPFLILCGLFMLIGGRHHHAHEHNHSNLNTSEPQHLKTFKPFLLGIIFSLAFCPYSGVMYFGMLIPMTMSQPIAWSWLMPVLYGLGTGLPVVIIGWLLAYSIMGIGKINKNIHVLEIWLRRLCALLFIGIGIYLCIHIFGGHHHHEHNHQVSHYKVSARPTSQPLNPSTY